ncbi:MAG: ATP12 family chaperone protein, partial [Halocynthiibacter sp.]
MSGWAQKRFWKTATAVRVPGGYSVQLDGRSLKTPAKADFVVPTHAMASAAADEWQAQEGIVDPVAMPTTRSANAAIDKVTLQHAEVAALIADYGGTDLICYRAEGPESLIARQAEVWNPLRDWSAEALGAPLITVSGVIFTPQPPASLRVFDDCVGALSAFELAGLHDLVSISGSLVIGLAVTKSFLSPQEAWRRARIDEQWQLEHWGDDEEASRMSDAKCSAFLHAARFFQMSR